MSPQETQRMLRITYASQMVAIGLYEKICGESAEQHNLRMPHLENTVL
jgi:hypothetical protein